MDFEDKTSSEKINDDNYALVTWANKNELVTNNDMCQNTITVFKTVKDLKNKKGRKGSMDLDEKPESLSVLKNLNVPKTALDKEGNYRIIKEENNDTSDAMDLIDTK